MTKAITPDFLQSLEMHMAFESILKYVLVPKSVSKSDDDDRHTSMRIYGKSLNELIHKRKRPAQVAIEVFNWLRKLGVKTILEVGVEEDDEQPHSDEDIEATMEGFGVEVWD
jgi:hypothetical protein